MKRTRLGNVSETSPADRVLLTAYAEETVPLPFRALRRPLADTQIVDFCKPTENLANPTGPHARRDLDHLPSPPQYVLVGLLLGWLVDWGHATVSCGGGAGDRGGVSAAGLYVAIDGVLTSGHIVEEVVPFAQAHLQDRYWADLQELFPEAVSVFLIPDQDAARHLVVERLDRHLAVGAKKDDTQQDAGPLTHKGSHPRTSAGDTRCVSAQRQTPKRGSPGNYSNYHI